MCGMLFIKPYKTFNFYSSSHNLRVIYDLYIFLKNCEWEIGHLLSNFLMEKFVLTFYLASLYRLALTKMFVPANPILLSFLQEFTALNGLCRFYTRALLHNKPLSWMVILIMGRPSSEFNIHFQHLLI